MHARGWESRHHLVVPDADQVNKLYYRLVRGHSSAQDANVYAHHRRFSIYFSVELFSLELQHSNI